MTKKKEDILRILKMLKEEIKIEYKVKSIGIFGSYINNEQTDDSDIDFLVEFEENADLFHFVGLTLFLEEQFNKKVDVVSKPALKEELRNIILQEVIYE